MRNSNGMVVKRFVIELDRKGLTDRRIKKYIILLRKLHSIKLIKLSRKSVDRFFFYLRDSPLSDETKFDYWCMFRIFIKWLKPKIDVTAYRLKLNKKRKMPEEILTLEEIRRIILNLSALEELYQS
jgi:integrase